jgi:hypothetical protein
VHLQEIDAVHDRPYMARPGCRPMAPSHGAACRIGPAVMSFGPPFREVPP